VDLLSEEEQWEALKRWIRTNGPSVAAMVIAMLAAYFGWQWWQARDNQKALAANVAYDQILLTFDANKIDAALAQIESLRKQHPGSAYVTAADLAAARVFVARNELDNAAQRLQRVTNGTPDQQLRPIARLRLARVQSAQGKFDEALATLAAAGGTVHQAAYTETRGDILMAKGDRAGALKEYAVARQQLPQEDQGVAGVSELLDLKIDDLRASASAAVPVAATAAP
jgi:predicted negative regulator of RcsB-dependent stress response